MENEELDIRPEAGILGVFSRLSYKAWYAIAEFVDNSTQSFFSNEEKFMEVHGLCFRPGMWFDDDELW